MGYNANVEIVKAYKYRLYPTAAQEAQLIQYAGCRRFVWNWGLARKIEVYKATGKSISGNTLSLEITQLKKTPEFDWLRRCAATVLTRTLGDLDKAFAAFFEKRSRFPKFKKRKSDLPAMRFQDAFLDGSLVHLPKVGRVKAAIHRKPEGELKQATVKQFANGAWFVFFDALQVLPDLPKTCFNSVGIDVGLETFATLSTGEKIKPPKFYRNGERKVARLQRRLSRCIAGSKRRAKAKVRFAKHHAKIANRRNDFLHKLSARLVAEYDTIFIEDLNIKGLMRTKLSKSFRDAALSKFLRQLEYKSSWHCGQVVKVGRLFPSSKMCSGCGTQTNLKLSDRRWICSACGLHHDRDVNAAQNILFEGLRILDSVAAGDAETLNAHGACVRLATASDER